MPTFLGVDFAPAVIPLHRRLQTAALLAYTTLYLVLTFVFILVSAVLLFTPLGFIPFIYSAWIVYDTVWLNRPSRGGRKVHRVRYSRFWHLFRDYFPIHLKKTEDLDPSKNYIFGCHPHGIMGCGVILNFATEANGFSKLYPGIEPYVLTLRVNFYMPLMREFLLALGLCDVSKESVKWIAGHKTGGHAAIIVVGGAEEALEAHPSKYRLTLKDRKGFVKLALQTGASLVPVFSFGENDLFQQASNPKGSWLRSFQEFFKEHVGFSPPLFYGRGVFNYTFGFLPHRIPIHTIVGKPIEVPKTTRPDKSLVDKYHSMYMEELKKLFDDHKSEYGVNDNTELVFV